MTQGTNIVAGSSQALGAHASHVGIVVKAALLAAAAKVSANYMKVSAFAALATGLGVTAKRHLAKTTHIAQAEGLEKATPHAKAAEYLVARIGKFTDAVEADPVSGQPAADAKFDVHNQVDAGALDTTLAIEGEIVDQLKQLVAGGESHENAPPALKGAINALDPTDEAGYAAQVTAVKAQIAPALAANAALEEDQQLNYASIEGLVASLDADVAALPANHPQIAKLQAALVAINEVKGELAAQKPAAVAAIKAETLAELERIKSMLIEKRGELGGQVSDGVVVSRKLQTAVNAVITAIGKPSVGQHGQPGYEAATGVYADIEAAEADYAAALAADPVEAQDVQRTEEAVVTALYTAFNDVYEEMKADHNGINLGWEMGNNPQFFSLQPAADAATVAVAAFDPDIHIAANGWYLVGDEYVQFAADNEPADDQYQRFLGEDNLAPVAAAGDQAAVPGSIRYEYGVAGTVAGLEPAQKEKLEGALRDINLVANQIDDASAAVVTARDGATTTRVAMPLIIGAGAAFLLMAANYGLPRLRPDLATKLRLPA